MVIYTVLAKKIEKTTKKSKKLKKLKKPRNNFWGPCQVLNITAIYLKTGVPENPLPDGP